MKIVQVAPSVSPGDGGPSVGIFSLHDGLRALGHDAVVVTTDAEGSRRMLEAARSQIASSRPGVHLHRMHFPRRLKTSLGMFREVWERGRTADVLHVHGHYLFHVVIVYLVHLRWDTPYAVQLHGVLEPYQRAKGRFRKQVFDALIGRRFLANAGFFITAARSEADAAAQVLPPGARIEVVPLGATVSRFGGTSPPTTFSAIPDSATLFLYLGRFAQKKQPELLIEAWSQSAVQGCHLAFVGPDDDWSASALQGVVRRFSAKNVSFHPMVQGDEKAYILERANVFVLPSLNENFGIAVAEAMAYGLAVITSSAVASAEHVVKAAGGIVIQAHQLSASTLADAIVRAAKDPDWVRRAGEAGSLYAGTLLTWEATATALVAAYSSITGSRRGGG